MKTSAFNGPILESVQLLTCFKSQKQNKPPFRLVACANKFLPVASMAQNVVSVYGRPIDVDQAQICKTES